MNNPKLYCTANNLQRRDAKDVIDEYLHLIRWKPSGTDTILDVGCGSGDITWDLLVPRLPKSFQKLVGTDLSKAMTKHAQAQYIHPNIEFTVLDIASDGVPDNYREKFDHIFSFYCLHWIQDQRRAMDNIFNLLRPGGDILLTFLGSTPLFEIYLRMSRMESWKSYMRDVQKFVSPYHNVVDVEDVLRKLLQEIGFQITVVECKEKYFEYPNLDIVKKSMTAVNPFIPRLPEKLKEQFILDYCAELKNLKLIEENNNNNNNGNNINNSVKKIHMTYSLIVISARKSL